MAHSIDRKTFLAHVRRSGLLTDVQLAEVLPLLPYTNRGRLVAREMVERGLLTRFQAERLLAGRTSGFLVGHYRILDELGRGGMARVYKAEHLGLKRVVALKVLAPELVQTERAQDLFRREMHVAASLAHPNIVTALDADEVDGRYFLVLEFIDGPNLEQLVRVRGPLALGLACDYVAQAAQALQCAYQAGLVHRDIKPANLLLQRKGYGPDAPGLIKISDFGLARLDSSGSDGSTGPAAGTIPMRENTMMGTPDFVSPEQARNLHSADIRSDIYSLGCSFYFLLTGQVPFVGGKVIEKLLRHTKEDPALLHLFRDDVPDSVQEILSRMMAKSPANRFQTPAEVAAALEPYAVSGPIPWAPPPPSSTLPEQPASQELSSLANTMPPGNTPTSPIEPEAGSGPLSRPGRARPSYKGSSPGALHWLSFATAVLLSLATLFLLLRMR